MAISRRITNQFQWAQNWISEYQIYRVRLDERAGEKSWEMKIPLRVVLIFIGLDCVCDAGRTVRKRAPRIDSDWLCGEWKWSYSWPMNEKLL